MQQQQQHPVDQVNSFRTGFSLPALQIPSKHYSLQADLITGWQPKMKVVGPVPLNFDAPICDQIVESLTTFGHRSTERVVYLGPRYASSFKLHQELRREYQYKYQSLINTNFPHLAAYFRKFYGHFKPKHARPFKGMNPTLKQGESVTFDGLFESANLDAAIKVGPNQYDLFMRVDSNTRGHLQWYNFTVKGQKKKVKLNIVNFRRSRSLYNMSMKPYFLSSVVKGVWKQGGLNVKYDQKPLRYQFLSQIFSQERLLFNCLSFEYQFQENGQIVQFAYCPPFTYSDNIKMIRSLHSMVSFTDEESQILKQEVASQTLGGLEIPLLTITDPNVPNIFKKCVLVSARIHPGETCGSYMVKGFLQFVCSNNPIAAELRKKMVFKVIPMVNPDGVVIGNFRTSLCGRDLNRMFRNEDTFLIPQVAAIKSVVHQLKVEFKQRLFFFLDFHGHSVRKNVFIYGPEYEIWQTNYYKTRILPKIISERTDMFRYYSCIFRISSSKRTTARAVLLKHIPHCYTIQASVGIYYSPNEKKDYDFTPPAWQQMGRIVAESIAQYFQLLEVDAINKEKKVEKQKKNSLLPKVKMSQQKSQKKKNVEQTSQNKLQRMRQIEQQLNSMRNDTNKYSDKARGLIAEIQEQSKNNNHSKDSKGNNDDYSEGGSDSEPAEDDFDEKDLSSLHHHIILSLKQFKERFYRREQAAKQRVFVQSSSHITHRKLEMIASLRKKAENINNSKPQIGNQKLVSAIGLPQGWVRGRTTRKVAHSAVEAQSFQVYVTKLQANRDIKQDCQISYFSPRKKMYFGKIGQG